MLSGLVVGLGGCYQDPSTTRACLDHALASVYRHGFRTTMLDLGKLEIPLYDPRARSAPTADVARMVEVVRSATAMLWAAPLYHGGPSAQFKNALDWLDLLRDDDPPYLNTVIVGLISVAPCGFALDGIAALENIARAFQARRLSAVAPIGPDKDILDPNGKLVDFAAIAILDELTTQLVHALTAD